MNPIDKSRLDLRLLGIPEMTWRGKTYSLARRQARALLYYLANTPNPVPRDKLLYLFWPDEPEEKARRNLTRLVSYLRKELPHKEILLAARESLRLNPAQVKVDTQSFTELCAEDASREEAVALYRETFLMGFSLENSPEFDFWLTEEGGRYETLYLKALAGLVHAKTEQREFAAAIQYAQRYLAVDALAEEIHRGLITLHAANGNRTAALQQYETCVIALERELGVTPLPETRAAYEAARQGKQVSRRQLPLKPAWTVLPSLDLALVGREAAWNALTTAYQQQQTGGLLLISGEAGVGKSRLMQEFATRSAHTVLAGNSHLSTQTLPYHPLVQALRQALLYSPLWEGIPPIWLGELSQLLPELHDHFPNLPQPLAVEPQQAQARLREALTQAFLDIAAHASPLLLCLDDLHWADEATLAWLSAVSRRLAGSQVCIMGTYRQEQPDAVRGVRYAFRRAGLLAEVALEGLSPQAISDLLAQVPGGSKTQSPLAARLARTTGGNTFFVLEMIRALLESGGLDTPPERLPLPETVQETIQTRLTRLAPLARQILETAAVLSPDLKPALLWETAGRAELESADGLDELVRRQLLVEGADGLAFRHDLLRTTVYEALSPWRRQALHRRAGEALGKVYTRHPESVAAQRAQHYDAARAYEQAVESYELAASTAQSVYAHEEAIRHLQRAIDLLPEIKASSDRATRLYEVLGKYLINAGRFDAAQEAFQKAIAFLSPENTMSLAQLYQHLGRTRLSQLLYGKAEILLERALTTLGEPPNQSNAAWQRIWLDIQMARLTLYAYLFDIERFDALVQEVIPSLEDTESLETKLEFYNRSLMIKFVKERYRPSPETLTLVKNNLKLALTTQNPWTIAYYHFALGYTLLHAGELNAAEGYFLESLALAREFDHRVQEARVLAFLSTLYRRMKDTHRTAEYARLAGEKGATVGSRHFMAHSLANLGWLAYQNGEITVALEKAQKATQDFLEAKIPFSWIGLMILFAIHLDKRELDQAIEVAAAMLDPSQQRLPDDLSAALEGAVNHWKAQDAEKTREFLEQAVRLAKKWGYL